MNYRLNLNPAARGGVIDYKGNIIKLIKHEIIHLLIENFINKNHISHKVKEKLVNSLCSKAKSGIL